MHTKLCSRLMLRAAAAVPIVLLTIAAGSAHKPSPDRGPHAVPDLLPLDSPAKSNGAVDIAFYDFDDGVGGPDPMGWVTIDRTAEEGTYFHVDDFAGLAGGQWGTYTPISGMKSLWCGARPGGELCYYATLPGYGNGWEQRFTSTAFNVTGDATIAFTARFESEAGYDQTALQYFTKSDRWHTIEQYNGRHGCCPVDSMVSETVPADSLDGTVQFRFRFTSDGAWSDEDGLYPTDGAVVIDDLVVTDDNGVVDSQDFEAEPVGALATLDGDWTASPFPAFGDHAALFDGSTVLQEDTAVTNNSYLWGFFDNSLPDTNCVLVDTQADLPAPKVVEGRWLFMNNGAISPPIDITNLQFGGVLPDSLELKLAFDVYLGMFDSGVRFVAWWRSQAGGCWGRWSTFGSASSTPQWWHQVVNLLHIPSDATHIQVGVGALQVWEQPCRTHAPLFDNVEVYAEGVTPTGVRGPSGARYELSQNLPNPFNPETVVRYTVPPPGGVVALRVYDVSGRLVRTLKEGHARAGSHVAVWDGRNANGQRVSSGVYFYRLSAPDFDQTRKMVLLK